MTDASESRHFIHDIRALMENHYGSNAYSFDKQYYYFAVVNTFGDEIRLYNNSGIILKRMDK